MSGARQLSCLCSRDGVAAACAATGEGIQTPAKGTLTVDAQAHERERGAIHDT